MTTVQYTISVVLGITFLLILHELFLSLFCTIYSKKIFSRPNKHRHLPSPAGLVENLSILSVLSLLVSLYLSSFFVVLTLEFLSW
jgi:hypothetical protein